MDVQAAGSTALAPPPSAQIFASPAPDTTSWPRAAASAGAVSVPVVSGTYPPAAPPNGSTSAGSRPAVSNDGTLTNGVAKLYNAQEQNVSVSFQIDHNPNEIVTVFTDKQTGKVIVQFPSETLVALAQFFDKLDGNVVNKQV